MHPLQFFLDLAIIFWAYLHWVYAFKIHLDTHTGTYFRDMEVYTYIFLYYAYVQKQEHLRSTVSNPGLPTAEKRTMTYMKWAAQKATKTRRALEHAVWEVTGMLRNVHSHWRSQIQWLVSTAGWWEDPEELEPILVRMEIGKGWWAKDAKYRKETLTE